MSRVHPRIQMLRGARLAVVHAKDWETIHLEDMHDLTMMHAREVLRLTHLGRKAYTRMYAPLFTATFRDRSSKAFSEALDG